MNKEKYIATMISVVSAISFACVNQVSAQVENGRPVRGETHLKELDLNQQLNRNFENGLIDSYELANMSRDLDAIHDREEKYKMRKQGMTPGKHEVIVGKLNNFQLNLDRHVAESRPQQTAVIAIPQ